MHSHEEGKIPHTSEFPCCNDPETITQPAFPCSKLTIEALEQGVKYTPCSSISVVNFEHVIAGWEESN